MEEAQGLSVRICCGHVPGTRAAHLALNPAGSDAQQPTWPCPTLPYPALPYPALLFSPPSSQRLSPFPSPSLCLFPFSIPFAAFVPISIVIECNFILVGIPIGPSPRACAGLSTAHPFPSQRALAGHADYCLDRNSFRFFPPPSRSPFSGIAFLIRSDGAVGSAVSVVASLPLPSSLPPDSHRQTDADGSQRGSY